MGTTESHIFISVKSVPLGGWIDGWMLNNVKDCKIKFVPIENKPILTT